MKKVIYVWLVRVVSWLAHFSKNDQVIYLMSFADNLDFIQQLNQRVPGRLTVYYLPSAATGRHNWHRRELRHGRFMIQFDLP